jgi:CMP-N-acetylneuraminic acid synthetase
MNTLAIIPARGGSKGVPHKNIKILAGKPLIQHSVEFARNNPMIDKIVISTDDPEIMSIAKKLGVDIIKRPDALSTDSSLVIDAVKHVLIELRAKSYYPDLTFLLEPTSPIRPASIVLEAIEAFSRGFDSMATFCACDPPPSRLWRIEGENISPFIHGANPFLPRQMNEEGFQISGQLYGFKQELILETTTPSFFGKKLYPIIVDSQNHIDIDTEVDFIIAEQLIMLNETS